MNREKGGNKELSNVSFSEYAKSLIVLYSSVTVCLLLQAFNRTPRTIANTTTLYFFLNTYVAP